MPMTYGRHAMAFLCLLLLASCGGALASRDLRFSFQESPILVRESGAIIVGKRQVGKHLGDGKIVDSFGRVLALIHKDSVRLRGGMSVAIKTDREGSVYLPESLQSDAGLKPMSYRIRPNGTMARTQGAEGLPIKGHLSDEARRLVLVILLLTENAMWNQSGNGASTPVQPVM